MSKEYSTRINVVEIVRLLKQDKKKLAIYSIVAGIIGVAIAFTTPKIYRSTVILAPEESGEGFSGSISSLASMVGMNMKIGQTGDALYPELYPDLVSSTDFAIGLFPVTVKTKDGKVKCDYFTYLNKHNKPALIDYPMICLQKLMQSFRKEEPKPQIGGTRTTPIQLTRQEEGTVKAISGNLQCQIDKKTSVITITVTDQDPLVAALMADSVKEHLQVAITDYKTKKARVDLEYMEQLFDEARKQYDKARQLYASYADANQEVTLQSFKMKEADLENDMQLKYNLYEQVVEQKQLAEAKVQERTPAFTVVQSATVPLKHSSRPKVITLAMWMMLGLALRIGILGYKNYKSFINL